MSPTISGFGERVLGKARFEEEQRLYKLKQDAGMGLGSRVTGLPTSKRKAMAKAKAEKEQAKAAAQAAGQSETTTTANETDVVATTSESGEAENGGDDAKAKSITLKQLEKALKANTTTGFFDEMLARELERPEGSPRKGALTHLINAERARGPDAREAVIKELEQLIKSS